MNFSNAKLAYRNLKLHRSKTLIIGVLITISVAILIMGSSILNTINEGIEENYVNNYTGSIFISPTDNAEPSLIMPSFDSEGANSKITNFNEVELAVNQIDGISDTTGQINSAGLIQFGENGTGFGIFRGIDPVDYENMFTSGINIVDGSFLKPGEEGVVLSQFVLDMLNSSTSEEVGVGDKILVTSMNETSGTKIREVTIRGVHQYDDDSIDISLINFLDLDSIRALNGILLNTESQLNLNDEEISTLGAFDENDLFADSSDSLFSDSDDGLFASDDDSLFSDIESEDIYNILGDTSQRDELNTIDDDAYSYMLVQVDDSANVNSVIKNLNAMFEANGWELTAYEWTKGAGMSAQMADVISIIFYAILALVAIVVVIVIMNTLVVSISERTNEIGTMRALGASKGYIRNMISLETIFITIIFGIIGIIIGVSLLSIAGQIGIQATGTFTKIIIGGDVFIPRISGSSILLSVVAITVVSVFSSLYPVAVALRISPREAMSK